MLINDDKGFFYPQVKKLGDRGSLITTRRSIFVPSLSFAKSSDLWSFSALISGNKFLTMWTIVEQMLVPWQSVSGEVPVERYFRLTRDEKPRSISGGVIYKESGTIYWKNLLTGRKSGLRLQVIKSPIETPNKTFFDILDPKDDRPASYSVAHHSVWEDRSKYPNSMAEFADKVLDENGDVQRILRGITSGRD